MSFGNKKETFCNIIVYVTLQITICHRGIKDKASKEMKKTQQNVSAWSIFWDQVQTLRFYRWKDWGPWSLKYLPWVTYSVIWSLLAGNTGPWLTLNCSAWDKRTTSSRFLAKSISLFLSWIHLGHSTCMLGITPRHTLWFSTTYSSSLNTVTLPSSSNYRYCDMVCLWRIAQRRKAAEYEGWLQVIRPGSPRALGHGVQSRSGDAGSGLSLFPLIFRWYIIYFDTISFTVLLFLSI